MPEHDLFGAFIRPLNRTSLRYMITGAAASIVYGEPRLTHDLEPEELAARVREARLEQEWEKAKRFSI